MFPKTTHITSHQIPSSLQLSAFHLISNFKIINSIEKEEEHENENEKAKSKSKGRDVSK